MPSTSPSLSTPLPILCLVLSSMISKSLLVSSFTVPSYNQASRSRTSCVAFMQRSDTMKTRSRRDSRNFVMNRVVQEQPICESEINWKEEIKRLWSVGDRSIDSFNSDLEALVTSGEGGAAQKAQDILEIMEKRWYQYKQQAAIKPNTATYTTVMNAWVNTVGGEEGATQALNLLSRMERLYNKTGDDAVKPNLTSYDIVIGAYSSCVPRYPGSAQRAQDILERMNNARDKELKANVRIYSMVLNAWAKSSAVDSTAAQKAEDLLFQMENLANETKINNNEDKIIPNYVSYTTCISAWAKSKQPQAAERAEAILYRMEGLHESGHFPDVKPDVISYTTAINAWSRQSRHNGTVAAHRAQAILDHMEHQFSTSSSNVRPNAVTYTTTIQAWAKSQQPESAYQAETILAKMESLHKSGVPHVKPKTFTYNAVIDALARSNGYEHKMSGEGAKQSERILMEMNRRYAAGEDDVKPNVHTYSGIILAWANSREGHLGAQRAQDILEKMEHLYESGETDVKPNGLIYSTVMKAWANASSGLNGQREAAIKAEAMLNRMERLHRKKSLKPNVMAYATVMKAWAKSGDIHASRNAERIMKQKYIQLNSSTYQALFKAVLNLMPIVDKARDQVVEAIFRECCREGQVTEWVLMAFERAASPRLYEKILKRIGGSANDGSGSSWEENAGLVTIQQNLVIPKEWSQNVSNMSIR